MITAANLQNIGSETAFAVLARATELDSEGRDIINLGIGPPDFKAPDPVSSTHLTLPTNREV